SRTLLLCLLSGCVGKGADPSTDGDRPPRRITETPGEFPTPFSIIRSVMALPDGRLLVTDPQENRLSLIEFDKGSLQPLSRVGGGPREYTMVGGFHRAPGGGVWMFDQQHVRMLPISTAGIVQDAVTVPAPATVWTLRGPDGVLTDTLGHYFRLQHDHGP